MPLWYEIDLISTYENGDRHRFQGQQTSETTFRGVDESWSWIGLTTEFVPVSDSS